MSARRLALVANFHRERLIGRKTADFVGRVHAHLASRGIDLEVEFVLDRPDAITLRQIEQAAAGIARSRLHVLDAGDLGAARRHGVAAARAEVVCFMDGDDYFSMNWFEAALDRLSGSSRKEVAHTQYMVGFDCEQFVRETLELTDPSFDPLSLAVDWYWSANLAIRQDVFAFSPIEPYDHDAGFGSEDWDWACNSLAAGVARISVPGTSYYYRVKPRRFSLGRVGDLINKASPLFSAGRLPPAPVAPSEAPPTVSPVSPAFYAQAREIEPFEVGLSWLREAEVGAAPLRHYKPHVPPVAGQVYREALAAGFGDGAVVVFADAQRLPGGLATARALADALAGKPGASRLYVLAGEGDATASRACPDGYILSVDHLRASRLLPIQVARLVARFFIQVGDVTVVDLLSPRAASTSLSFCRATRWSVQRWIAVVVEHGFDCLSRAYDELDAFDAAGIACERIAVFAKTADEAARIRGRVLAHDPALEAAFVAGDLGRGGFSPAPWSSGAGALGRPSPAESRVFRLGAATFLPKGDAANPASGGLLTPNDALRALAEREEECVLVSGAARLGLAFPPPGASRAPGLTIPALTIIDRDAETTLLVRHPVELFAGVLREGRFPMNLAATGALGVDTASLRLALRGSPGGVALAALIEIAVERALQAGLEPVRLFAPDAVVEAAEADVELIERGALAAAVERNFAARQGIPAA